MTKKIQPTILKGTRDFLPPEMMRRNVVMGLIRKTFEQFGYSPIETPIICPAETILGKYGEERGRLTYSFKDRGGRQVALPYDLTVPFARYVAANYRKLPYNLSLLLKRKSLLSLFRDQKKKRKMKSRSNEWKMVNKRQFLVPCQNFPAEILFVRHSDIPQYVQYGAADFGIIGENLLYENDFKVRIIKKLGFGKCDLVLAVPKGLDIEKISELEGERIATFYPNSLRKFLEKEKINAAIVEIKGVVEVTPALGLANAICDITQTGKTLRKNNLKPIVTILKSEAVLIKSMIKKKKNGCLK